MYDFWKDAFRISQDALLFHPSTQGGQVFRTLQNESLSNALETFPTDYKRQIKMIIGFFTFVSWILKLFYFITPV